MRDPMIHPRSACERRVMRAAVKQMRSLMKSVPMYRAMRSPVIDSAMREHALFYARERCEGRSRR